MKSNEITKVAVFEGKHIRKILHEGEWWFSVIDVVEVLTGSERPRKYWNDLKKKLISEGYIEVSEKIGQLKMPAPDGKMRFTDCANTETMFRIIQSIPSPKVEPRARPQQRLKNFIIHTSSFLGPWVHNCIVPCLRLADGVLTEGNFAEGGL